VWSVANFSQVSGINLGAGTFFNDDSFFQYEIKLFQQKRATLVFQQLAVVGRHVHHRLLTIETNTPVA